MCAGRETTACFVDKFDKKHDGEKICGVKLVMPGEMFYENVIILC